MRKALLILLVLISGGGSIVFYLRQNRDADHLKLRSEVADLRLQLEKSNWERNWFRFFLEQYGGFERLRQYGRPDATTALYHGAASQFIDIERVTQRLLCPPQAGQPFDRGQLYFGSRMLALAPTDRHSPPDIIALSYLGRQTYTHDRPLFDALLSAHSLSAQRSEKIVEINGPAGLLASFLAAGKTPGDLLAQPDGYFSPFTLNTGDVDGDSRPDFILGKLLYLGKTFEAQSGKFTGTPKPLALPGESIFVRLGGLPYILSLNRSDSSLILLRFDNNALSVASRASISHGLAKRVPFTLIPLPELADGAMFGVRSDDALHIYRIDPDRAVRHLVDIIGFQTGEITAGGFGRFVSKTADDFWLAQPLWKNPEGKIVGRIHLLSGDRLQNVDAGPLTVDELSSFRIDGSLAFTNYDGIGTSLSLYAGDIDGDGRLDFSFSGHRHMNEAGVLFILPGAAIAAGGVVSVEDLNVIKILGKPVSQLAPPYQHWDAADLNGDGNSDIIVAADNDLCSGLNAGAIYILDGKSIVSQWSAVRAR